MTVTMQNLISATIFLRTRNRSFHAAAHDLVSTFEIVRVKYARQLKYPTVEQQCIPAFFPGEGTAQNAIFDLEVDR